MRLARRLALGALAAALLLVLPGGEGGAHPFGRSFYSHRVVLSLDGGKVRVAYHGEVPTQVVMKEFAAAYAGKRRVGRTEDLEFLGRTIDAMASRLTVEADGRPVSMRNLSDRGRKNGKGDYSFFRYRVDLEGDLAIPPGARVTVRVRNDNRPDLPAWHSGAVLLPGDMVLAGGNLASFPAEAKLDDPFEVAAAWTDDPSFRVLEAVVARDRGGVAGSLQRAWRRAAAWWDAE